MGPGRSLKKARPPVMRRGRRGLRGWTYRAGGVLLAMLVLARLGGGVLAQERDATGLVRLTVEIRWSAAALPPLPEVDARGQSARPGVGGPVIASVTAGRILDAVNRASVEDGRLEMAGWSIEGSPRPVSGGGGRWHLGNSNQGSARVRLEVPSDAGLLVEAGGQSTRFTVSGLLEAPQQTMPQAPVVVHVERLKWDPIEIELTEGDGVYGEGAKVPVTLGFNVLTPEPGQVTIRYALELRPIRGGPVLWRFEPAQEVVPTNQLRPPRRLVHVPLPAGEGTYVLTTRATWEPVVGPLEGSRLGRFLKRKKASLPNSAQRTVSLAVLGTGTLTKPPGASDRVQEDRVADSVDFSRGGPGRPRASGRTPLLELGGSEWALPEAAMVQPGLRDRLRGWISRSGECELGGMDPSGLAWSAVPMRVGRPGSAHRLRVTIAGGPPEALAVAMVVLPGADVRPRVLLDACATESTGDREQDATVLSWPVWPDSAETVVLLMNRSSGSTVRVRSVELVECGDELPVLSLVETHASAPRWLCLDVSRPGDLYRFGAIVDNLATIDRVGLARNLSHYLSHCGASALVLPDLAAERRDRLRLDGQAAEDGTAADLLELTLRVLARRDQSVLVALSGNGLRMVLPDPGSEEAREQGLVALNEEGQPSGLEYHLLAKGVRQAIWQRLEHVIAPRRVYPNLLGVVVRLGTGSTLLGLPDTGLDDQTYAEFVRACFPADEARRMLAQGTPGPDRFRVRGEFVMGPARTAWLDWRVRKVGEVYSEFAARLREVAPGSVLAVITPDMEGEAARVAALRADREGLPADKAWIELGLDFRHWPSNQPGLVVVRGMGYAHDDLTNDLATSPELDSAVMSCAVRGVWIGEVSRGRAVTAGSRSGLLILQSNAGRPEGYFGHAVAALDVRWIMLGQRAVCGYEEKIGRFARVFRALPSPEETALTPRLSTGVAVRSWSVDGRTYVGIANDTPYEILQSTRLSAPLQTPVDDLGRGVRLEPSEAEGGGQLLVLRLPPFGVSAVRLGAPAVKVEPMGTYLPGLAEIEAQVADLSARLGRVGGNGELVGLPDPGFEHGVSQAEGAGAMPAAAMGAEVGAEPSSPHVEPLNWVLAGSALNRVSLDFEKPRSGRSALRLEIRELPAAVLSQAFLPPGGRELRARLWLRSNRPDGRVRIWFEGASRGESILRRVELPTSVDWTEHGVRLSDMPAEGLDRLQLRVEWLGPVEGTLWLDDLSIIGEGESESGRRAHLALLEALQAYRGKRYADFARLLGVHRARRGWPWHDRTESNPVRTGRSTDLPANRRLR